jgi:hypothetical protein
MTEKRIFHLAHDQARRGVAQFAQVAPEGWRVTFEPPKRGLDINAAMHATLGEIAARVTWAGKRWSIEAWKRMLVAAWSRAVGLQIEIAPALDGMGVDVIYSPTSEMSQEQVRDLLGFIDAWKAERPEFQEVEA